MTELTDLLKYHAEGLHRVAKVIQTNHDYDALMQHKLTQAERAEFGDELPIEEKRERAVALISKKLRGKAPKIVVPEFSGFTCEGSTRNNLREFEFFERICSSLSLKLLDSNYSELTRVSAGTLSNGQKAVIPTLIADVENFYRLADNISVSLVHQHLLYCRSFLSFFLSFSMAGAVRPAAFVVANDHSPVRVALTMVFKAMAVPRIYIQHAEVTENFPPLDFEFSVLRNRKALETYRRIGPIHGRAFVIPREAGSFAAEALARKRGEGVVVAVYPTSSVVADPLRDLLVKLSANPAVSRIIIKEHPGALDRLRYLSDMANVEFSASFPDMDHVAIVSNSSVAVELLHRGIPVYQNFDFDPVARDYYGLVRDGVTFEISRDDAAHAFWKPYELTPEWLEAYSAWDASATQEFAGDQQEFVEAMSRIRPTETRPSPYRARRLKVRMKAQALNLAKRSVVQLANSHPRLFSVVASSMLHRGRMLADFLSLNIDRAGRYLTARTDIRITTPIWRSPTGAVAQQTKPIDQKELLRFWFTTAAEASDPARWLADLDRFKILAPEAAMSAINLAFQERNPLLGNILARVDRFSPDSPILTWVFMKKMEWSNSELSSTTIESLAKAIHDVEGSVALRRNLERELLETILRSGTCAQLDLFWKSATALTMDRLPLAAKFKILRKLRQEGGRDRDAADMRRMIEEASTRLDLLKLDNSDFLDGAAVGAWNHEQAEQRFLTAAPRQIASQFRDHVKPVYDLLRPRMVFMNLRGDKSEADRLRAMVGDALTSRKPFSMIRLSDGEGYLFPAGRFFTAEDAANRERHWWGTELTADLRSEIIDGARRAVSDADVIGIPSAYRFIRDCTEATASLDQYLQGRGMLDVLSGLPSLIRADALVTEDKANVALYADPSHMTSLLDRARAVFVISSVLPSNLPPVLRDHASVQAIGIPTHNKTSLNDKYVSNGKALPFLYTSILDEIDARVGPGDLVVVAGGIVGKIFIGRARDRGAVVIDLGHVIDDWLTNNLTSIR